MQDWTFNAELFPLSYTQPVTRNILLTGVPGVGKTTLLRKLVNRYSHLAVTGFYTEEIRAQGSRVGFCALTLSGGRAVFAHRDFRANAKHRVGKYGVNLEILQSLVLTHLDPYRKKADLVVIDEIAKMELFSDPFRESLLHALDSPVPVLGTISLKGGGLIKRVKKRDDVALLTVTPNNRDVLGEEIYRRLSRVLASSSPRVVQTAFIEFIHTFDSGNYWQAHEVLEDVWKADRRDIYKGLIQVAAGWVHLDRNNRAGVLKVLPRAIRYLQKYAPTYQGWDLDRLISDCHLCLESVRPQKSNSVSPEGPCFIRMADYYQHSVFETTLDESG